MSDPVGADIVKLPVTFSLDVMVDLDLCRGVLLCGLELVWRRAWFRLGALFAHPSAV